MAFCPPLLLLELEELELLEDDEELLLELEDEELDDELELLELELLELDDELELEELLELEVELELELDELLELLELEDELELLLDEEELLVLEAFPVPEPEDELELDETPPELEELPLPGSGVVVGVATGGSGSGGTVGSGTVVGSGGYGVNVGRGVDVGSTSGVTTGLSVGPLRLTSGINKSSPPQAVNATVAASNKILPRNIRRPILGMLLTLFIVCCSKPIFCRVHDTQILCFLGSGDTLKFDKSDPRGIHRNLSCISFE